MYILKFQPMFAHWMNTVLKYVPNLSLNIKPRFKAYYLGKKCDPQSICAKTAIAILLLMEKKKDIPEQNTLIKEEIYNMLNHEKLLTEYGCCALSRLTIQELLRLMLQNKTKEELFLFVEEIDLELEKKYSSYLQPFFETKLNLQALTYKHMGNGVKFLAEMQKTGGVHS